MYTINANASLAYSALSGALPMIDERPTVVVIDDDISVREALGPLLLLAGWQVHSFESASAYLT